MNIYRISQTVNRGQNNQYGSYYRSAVVLAESEEEARVINPQQDKGDPYWSDSKDIQVELVGKMDRDFNHQGCQIICSDLYVYLPM